MRGDISPSHLLRTKLPPSWRGIITALESSTNQQARMGNWLRLFEKHTVRDRPCWTQLLVSLSRDEPSQNPEDSSLTFVPLMLHLTSVQQQNLLEFILSHRQVIVHSALEHFTATLLNFLQTQQLQNDPETQSPRNEDVTNTHDSVKEPQSQDVIVIEDDTRDHEKKRKNVKMSEESHEHEMRPDSDVSFAWTLLWLRKLKHFLEKNENKNDWYTFTAPNLSYKRVILDAYRNRTDKPGTRNPWRSVVFTKEQETEIPPLNVDLSQTSKIHEESLDHNIMENESAHSHSTLGLTQSKKIKLDSTTSEDVFSSSICSNYQGIPDHLVGGVQSLKDGIQACSADLKPADFHVLTQCSADVMEDLCKVLDLETLPEADLAVVAMTISSLKESLPLTHAATVTRHCLLGKMLSLDGSASRHLYNACTSLTEAYPTSVIQRVIVPLLQHDDVGNYQCDVIIRLTRDSLQDDDRVKVIRSYVEKKPVLHAAVIPLIQYFIDTKTMLESETVSSLVTMLYQSSTIHTDNLKFGKLVLALVKLYGSQMKTQQITELDQAMAVHKTFLKKSVQNTLKKLNK